MSCYLGSKISVSQQYFLTQTAICIFAFSDSGSKVWATVLLLSAVRHRKVLHVNFFSFFLQYLQYHVLLRSRIFATMAT